MKAVLRRTSPDYDGMDRIVMVEKNQVNLQTGKVYCENKEIVLTAMEYKLLLVFLNYRGQNLTRKQILDCIWDDVGDFVNDNALSVYIKRLRKNWAIQRQVRSLKRFVVWDTAWRNSVEWLMVKTSL